MPSKTLTEIFKNAKYECGSNLTSRVCLKIAIRHKLMFLFKMWNFAGVLFGNVYRLRRKLW